MAAAKSSWKPYCCGFQPRILLFSKRISQTCCNVHDSKAIKKALFLYPGTALNTSDEASFPQPGVFCLWESVSRHGRVWMATQSPLPEATKHGVSFDPLLVVRFTGPNHFNTAILRVLRHREEHEASYCRMFITQPPLWMMTVRANKSHHYANGAGEEMVILK
ncbi:hypothetical protein AC579_1045 [Pseudocercospora musae]|uniref:Uncharacterized protein n=1 Tax=Pseudocercospora musae TaxID=113226 RepID=A0A139HP17_9PEZI|nr:hypothetical protein AC579_1045 [Pseudocercospora musae]